VGQYTVNLFLTWTIQFEDEGVWYAFSTLLGTYSEKTSQLVRNSYCSSYFHCQISLLDPQCREVSGPVLHMHSTCSAEKNS